MNIAQRLKKVRKQRNLSVYKLAHISGVSQKHIYNIEKGINQPSIDTIRKILKSIGIPLEEFFSDSLDICYINDFEKELLQSIHLLTKQQADIILKLIKNMN